MKIEQQELCMPSVCYLLIMIGDNEICGIVDEENALKADSHKLAASGFYLDKIEVDFLYKQALDILQEEEII